MITSTNYSNRKTNLAIVAAALGYFVDLYDILIFSIVRTKSLLGIGVLATDLVPKGILLLDIQMLGMLLGGFFWGVLGDKKGRLSVLFGSIIMYSVANLANGFVETVESYAFWRFFAGVGLAGELGAGLTLVHELISKEKRSFVTSLINVAGILGAMTGAVVGGWFSWQTAYWVGGGMGLCLLILRIGVVEPQMFMTVKEESAIERGNFLLIFATWQRFSKYLAILFIGALTWFVAAIIISFTPEIAKAMGMEILPEVPMVVLWAYTGFAIGNLSSGFVSHYFKSRKIALFIFITWLALGTIAFFAFGGQSVAWYYAMMCMMGIGTGKNAALFTLAAEQFGTNIRATAVTTATNFIRAFAIPYTLLFKFLLEKIGTVNAAISVGILAFTLAYWAMMQLEETFGKDIDFIDS
jgi:putative MFS transporter